MSNSNLELEAELLSVAREAALAAGAELTLRWRKPVEVKTKTTPTDPVSEADVAAEGAIRAVFARRRPGDAILGEEGGQTSGDGSSDSGLRWVIDPLDGTVNYLYGFPSFAVSIVVEDARGGLAACVLEPVTGEMFIATRSGPALLLPGGGREVGAGVGAGSGAGAGVGSGGGSGSGGGDDDSVELHGSGCVELERALIGTGFSYSSKTRALQTKVLSEVLPRARDIRRIGAAALDMCWVAAGRLDGYWERGVKPWDIGAGMLICQRAGLAVRELTEIRDGEGEILLRGGVVTAPEAYIDELEMLVAGPGTVD